MGAGETLLVDRAAAAARPQIDEQRAWAHDQRAFVSSVIGGYADYRHAAASAIEQIGVTPVLFERFGGRDDDPHRAYLSEVVSSDIYVGLLGAKYGVPLPSRFSATHSEYLEAEARGLRISPWVQTGAEREGHQEAFVKEVRQFHTTGAYETPDELHAGVIERLAAIAAEDLSPWCKLGPLIFRAISITERGDRCTIAANVKDPAVADRLVALGDNRWRGQTLLTYGGRTMAVSVTAVEQTIRAARSKQFNLELAVSPAPADSLAGVATTGYTADDLTEIALRTVLLGEENPLGRNETWFQLPNPIPTLADLGLSDEALRPILHLLLAEVLVGSGRASRVHPPRLGPTIAGKRALRVSWTTPALYGAGPEDRTIEGIVAL